MNLPSAADIPDQRKLRMTREVNLSEVDVGRLARRST